MITAAERDAMLARLAETRELVHRTVEGLSAAQLQYRSDPARWSIAENIEHIVIVEQRVLGGIEKTLQQPADPAKRSSLTDEKFHALISRVVEPLKAPEFVSPTSRWPFNELMREFDSTRKRTREFAVTAADTYELRRYFMPHPAWGDLDCYQWLMLLAGHVERHCTQCEGVKSAPGFPR